jgi:hypothetical protein
VFRAEHKGNGDVHTDLVVQNAMMNHELPVADDFP